ncbi:MAG: transcription elongation factor GreA [Actinomycetota bacterium]|nr:transcription elongation factor GreA [Actinomycetota bacterium]
MAEERSEQLTAKQRAAIEAELAELEGPRRAAVVEAIKTAREHGDLSENFEYHAAKNEQGFLEARIRTLRHRLAHALPVDEAAIPEGAVGTGSVVRLEDDAGETIEVEISSVGGPGTVSPDSPLGRALLGRRAGDEVEVDAPSGRWKARVVSVSRP